MRTSSLILIASLSFCALAQAKPNVVFFVIDNVNFEHMGECYGGFGYTPHMDRVARQGITFDRAYATTPLCIPSRYSCLTGRFASNCTAPAALKENPADQYWTGQGIEIEIDRPNIGAILKAAGYRTGFVGKYHLKHGELPPLLTDNHPRVDTGGGKSGWDSKAPPVIENLTAKHDALRVIITDRGFDYADRFTCYQSLATVPTWYYGQEHNMEWELEGALEFLAQTGDQPFLLYWASSMAHLPLHTEETMLDTDALRMTKRGLLPESDAPSVPMPSREEIHDLALDDQRSNKENAFRIGMAWLDAAFGALLEQLESTGQLDNTLVIVFSDNTIAGGKDTIYENGARVPALAMWPGVIPEDIRSSKLVANVDFAPTIYEACGIDSETTTTDCNGRSLMPILTNQNDTPWRDHLLLESGFTRALVTEDWKYVALRYPDEITEKIRQWDESSSTLADYKMSPRTRAFVEASVARLPEPVRPLAANPYRWHKTGNNYIKSMKNHPRQFDPDQLYNLDTDYDELENIAAEHPEKVHSLQTRLKTAGNDLTRPFAEFSPEK
jgi:arylsulfatase A-like enzyme